MASVRAHEESYRIMVRAAGADVEAWSSARLPFEPKGWLVGFRRELAAACRTLAAVRGQVLHATYASPDRGRVDVENALAYNLGSGAIHAAARFGLVLERAFTPHLTVHRHHYRYRLVDEETGWAHWVAGKALGSVRLCASRALFSEPKAGRWWFAARQGNVLAHECSVTVPERFGLSITVTPPQGWRGSLTGLLKPLADGLVAALHAHDGSVEDAVLARAAKIDPLLRPDTLRALLIEPAVAPLGRVRLVVPRADGVMWLPADDRLVALDVRLAQRGVPGTVVADAVEVAPSAIRGWVPRSGGTGPSAPG